MKSEKMIVAGAVFSFCAAFSALGVSTVAEGKLNAGCEAVWMWYPGEYGIWRGNKLQFERLQWGAELAPFWPSYGFNPVAEFSATFDLAEPEK